MRQRRFVFAFFPYPTPYSAAQSGPEPTTYNITINEVENGTLETSVTNGIAAGRTVNVYATPLEGYKIASVTTNGSELVGDSFEMPAENVTIAATFAEIPKIAQIGSTTYPSLGAAIAALTGAGETIELLDNYTAADNENLTFTKNATLNLGGFELTVPPAVLRDANEKMWFKVADGAEVSFENGTITMGDSAYGLQVHGTAIVSCTMTKNDQTKSGPLFDIYGLGQESTNGGTVIVVAGADLQSDCDIFRHKKLKAKASVIISGGTMTATAIGTCNHQGIFFGSAYPSADDVVTITGGKFIGQFDNASDLWGNGNIKFGAEASAALFDGTAKLRMANYLADGYELVESTTETGFWQIAKIPSFDVTFTKDNVAIAGSTTNVLRGTTLTADMIPVITDAGAWDVNPTNAVITCATNFNFTVATPLTPGEDIAKDLEGTKEEKAQAAAVLNAMFNATGATEAEVNTWLGNFSTKPTAAQIADAKSLDVSYNLGATTLFAQDPTAEIKTIEQAEPATAGKPCYELTFQITDGTTPATPAQLEAVQGYVATLVQCNSKLDFGSETKLVPTVTVTLDGTATIKAKVELPSGGTSAFMKVATPATED